MKEEKQENPFKRPTQPSMKRRSNEHDYTSQCFYMVTMAVEGRRPLLGSVIGQCEAPADSVKARPSAADAAGRGRARGVVGYQ